MPDYRPNWTSLTPITITYYSSVLFSLHLNIAIPVRLSPFGGKCEQKMSNMRNATAFALFFFRYLGENRISKLETGSFQGMPSLKHL